MHQYQYWYQIPVLFTRTHQNEGLVSAQYIVHDQPLSVFNNKQWKRILLTEKQEKVTLTLLHKCADPFIIGNVALFRMNHITLNLMFK